MNDNALGAGSLFVVLLGFLGVSACTIRSIARIGTLGKRGFIVLLGGLIGFLCLYSILDFGPGFSQRLMVFWPATLLATAIVNLIVSLYFDWKGIWTVIAGFSVIVFALLGYLSRWGSGIKYG